MSVFYLKVKPARVSALYYNFFTAKSKHCRDDKLPSSSFCSMCLRLYLVIKYLFLNWLNLTAEVCYESIFTYVFSLNGSYRYIANLMFIECKGQVALHDVPNEAWYGGHDRWMVPWQRCWTRTTRHKDAEETEYFWNGVVWKWRKLIYKWIIFKIKNVLFEPLI